jgi:MYXO-CTERM domain-containing protein
MRADRLLAAAALTSLALAFAPATAHAFCRTRTVAPPPDFDPTVNQTGCFEQGAVLYHPSQCVPYHLLAAESPEIPRTVLSSSLARAFGAWSSPNATCTPGITAVELTPVTDAQIAQYTTGERGHNVIGVVEGPWPHAGAGETLSLATLTFDANTGEIFDADLELRSDLAWSTGATTTPDGYDLDAIMTHETGHVLGLAHSQLGEAVMFASYTPGSSTQRKLAPDDARAICAIYPDRQTRIVSSGAIAATACDLSPSAAAVTTCNPDITHGCAVASPSHGSPRRDASWLAVLGAVAAIAWRSRRRARRSEREAS